MSLDVQNDKSSIYVWKNSFFLNNQTIKENKFIKKLKEKSKSECNESLARREYKVMGDGNEYDSYIWA